MPKFAKQVRVPAREPDLITHQGGEGFSRDAKNELFFLGLTNAVGENTFYESADVRDKRFGLLIAEVTAEDPEWVRSFGAWLRSQGLMRSASIVVAGEYVRAGGPEGRSLVRDVIQRADEPAEMLSYWMSRHGRAIPAAIKRGVADAVRQQYNERNALRYDGVGNVMRFGDVIDLVHPRPRDEAQSALFRYLIDRRHDRVNPELLELLPTIKADRELMALPEGARRASLHRAIEAGWSWERVAGWLPGGMNAAAWEAVIPNMGAMALVRNLRNFDQAGLSQGGIRLVQDRLGDAEEIRKSRQFPIRFLSAWKNVRSMHWGSTLEKAVDLSVDNIPEFKGNTLVLIDVSGSMNAPLISARRGRGENPLRWEAAALFGLAVAKRSDAADVYTFNTSPHRVQFGPTDSVLRTVQGIRCIGGTDVLGSLVATYQKGVHDRVVILSDEQTGSYGNWISARDIKVPVTMFNLAGYRGGATPQEGNFTTIGGLSDAAFSVLPFLERGRGQRFPWEVS